MFVRKYVIPGLAVLGVLAAVRVVINSNQPVVAAEPVAPPARSPFMGQVAGAGLVEASSENIAIGTNVAGVVMRVYVAPGDAVKAGDPLFTIDDRSTRAELAVREAALKAAEANLEKLRAQPRREEVPPAEARLAEAQTQLDDAQDQLARIEAVQDRRAVTEEELTRRKFAVLAWRTRVTEAQAALDLLKAGAWRPDLDIAQAEVDSARSQVQAAKTELERLTVRSPVEGEVLQRNVRQGEFAQAGPLSSPLMVVGSTQTLHIRVDIDENDAWRWRPDAKAVASLRGNSTMRTDLAFVRVEPYVVPKRSLTGESSERVDTRVLQVLYAFPRSALPVYVGQQMDVFIESVPPGATAAPQPAPAAGNAGPA